MLHVLVGAECNNNCIFCMEADREGRRAHILGQREDDIRRMIAEYPARDEILFTSGEPTTNRSLPRYIAWAREAGYETIGIISNGRTLSYARYAALLLRAGLTKITLSIHGHQAKLHDSLTRTPGSFDQAMEGLDNLVRARSSSGRRLDIHTSTVLVRRNLPHVGAIIPFLAGRGVDRLCFNVMMAKGRGEAHFDRLMPRYREVTSTFRALVPTLYADLARRITIADVPPCVLEQLPPALRGIQEKFDQYEPRGSSGIMAKGISELTDERPHTDEHLASLASRASSLDLDGDDEYYMTTRDLKDNLLRVKGPPCAVCDLAASCDGVWATYVDRFGWDELAPVTTRDRRSTTDEEQHD